MSDGLLLLGSSVGKESSVRSEYVVADGVLPERPSTAPFQRRGAGGGGGAGGGRGGLGSRHATKDVADVLPRKMHGIGSEAARVVASKPPRPTTPKAGAFDQRPPERTIFKEMYNRGDLPVSQTRTEAICMPCTLRPVHVRARDPCAWMLTPRACARSVLRAGSCQRRRAEAHPMGGK